MSPPLEFGDDELTMQDLIIMKDRVKRMYEDLYNGGREGLITKFTKFVSDHDGREDERDKAVERRHTENSEAIAAISNKLSHRTLAWTIAGVFVAILALIGCIIGLELAYKVAHGDPIPLLKSQTPIVERAVTSLPNMR